MVGIDSPAQKRASLRWLRKQRTRVLALVPRGSQLTTSKRPPPNASSPSGSPCTRPTPVSPGPPGLMNSVPIRSLGLAGEVADHREADRAPVRAVPVERHPDPRALQVRAGRIARAPGDRGADAVRPSGRGGPVRARRRPRRRPRARRDRPCRRGSGARAPPGPRGLHRGRPAGAASSDLTWSPLSWAAASVSRMEVRCPALPRSTALSWRRGLPGLRRPRPVSMLDGHFSDQRRQTATTGPGGPAGPATGSARARRPTARPARSPGRAGRRPGAGVAARRGLAIGRARGQGCRVEGRWRLDSEGVAGPSRHRGGRRGGRSSRRITGCGRRASRPTGGVRLAATGPRSAHLT